MIFNVGLDIGSTTVKIIILDCDNKVVFSRYTRHFSKISECILSLISEISTILDNQKFRLSISGSAGLGIAQKANIPFVQEVFALSQAVSLVEPDSDVVIELGGEDAKILFLTGGFEERMNGTCAGGTGAFIDQMATLLNIDIEDMDELYKEHTTIYPIASRCGVFAKSDIQPLINQGAKKADIVASIFQAVVEQTVSGLAQGRTIKGKVLFLGGPLCFNSGLRERFVETLKLDNCKAHEFGQYFVALGASLYAKEQNELFTLNHLENMLDKTINEKGQTKTLPPLFKNEEEYEVFKARHDKNKVEATSLDAYVGEAYLGIDVGSTTSKIVLISKDSKLLYTFYSSNKANPVDVVLEELKNIFSLCKDNIKIKSSCVTGYGEELIKTAFNFDYGIVETIAHFTAAAFFNPNVDYIIDIGGQDMKCFKIANKAIDNIILNEACSSGCGSFVETFAKAMGYDIIEFTKLGIFAKNPVDLGSRCTVFMNSSVKQAQRDGATIEDISAGIAMSVIKNAIYKVLRIHSAKELGENIVVQGGTFLNNAILRSFEQEINHNVVRPNIAGLMGAFGAALYAKEHSNGSSKMLSLEELLEFSYSSKTTNCGLCSNHCSLTINKFSNGKTSISGNKCQKGQGFLPNELPNMYEFTIEKVRDITKKAKENFDKSKPTIGIPLALNMFENIAFWYALFENLGYNVVFSDESSKKLYASGQFSIPSDTVCYPAKLVHGHIESLISKGVKHIFYPCSSYNFDEKRGDNHYNCPVVAYYPEVIKSNSESVQNIVYDYPYIGLADAKFFPHKFYEFMGKSLNASLKDIKKASKVAYKAYEDFKTTLDEYGYGAIKYARDNNKKIIVLAGRPYHVDRQINHSIDKTFNSLDFVVISERVAAKLVPNKKVNVLNQWTYHSRMYDAASYVCRHDDTELVQLVSFGCGLDAVTTDEIREILEANGKIYTQLKIDDIENLGAVKIRARSLKAAIQNKAEKE